MHAEGSLLIAGRRVARLGELLREALRRWGIPGVIVCDRWREAELRQELEAVRFPLTSLVIRGQGFRDGAADVRAFRAACLNGQVEPERSLLLRNAMSEARVTSDAAANFKLSKRAHGGRRSAARNDAVATAILTVSEGRRRVGGKGGDTPDAARPARPYRVIGVA